MNLRTTNPDAVKSIWIDWKNVKKRKIVIFLETVDCMKIFYRTKVVDVIEYFL